MKLVELLHTSLNVMLGLPVFSSMICFNTFRNLLAGFQPNLFITFGTIEMAPKVLSEITYKHPIEIASVGGVDNF